MAKIDGTSALINALRSQLATRTESQRGTPVNRTGNQSAAPAAITAEQLQIRIGRELKRLDLRSATGRRQARQVFLESVLAWDLGEQLLTDARFGFVIKDVEESIEAAPQVSQALDELLLHLQDSASN